MLYIGADHGGFTLKEELKSYFDHKEIKYVDVGAKKMNPDDDYTTVSEKVASQVSKNPAKHQGILICRSGQGVCVAANKFPNIEATLCWETAIAKASRYDDDSNILCLPADYISTELAEEICSVWLTTKFSFEERHIRRLEAIRTIERNS